MKKFQKVKKLHERLLARGIDLNYVDVDKLRHQEMILHSWCEWECGLDNGRASYAIVRDEKTQKPFVEYHPYNGPSHRKKCADRETGALNRIKAICAKNNLHFYYQTDPRGCALFVSKEPLNQTNYTNGAAICD